MRWNKIRIQARFFLKTTYLFILKADLWRETERKRSSIQCLTPQMATKAWAEARCHKSGIWNSESPTWMAGAQALDHLLMLSQAHHLIRELDRKQRSRVPQQHSQRMWHHSSGLPFYTMMFTFWYLMSGLQLVLGWVRSVQSPLLSWFSKKWGTRPWLTCRLSSWQKHLRKCLGSDDCVPSQGHGHKESPPGWTASPSTGVWQARQGCSCWISNLLASLLFLRHEHFSELVPFWFLDYIKKRLSHIAKSTLFCQSHPLAVFLSTPKKRKSWETSGNLCLSQ